MTSVGEIACSYAALILADGDVEITSEKIATLVKTANVKIESYWPGLFAKLAEKRKINDLISTVGAGGGGAAPSGGAAAAPVAAASAAPAVEEKKEEPQEESDGDLGFGLFD